MKQEHGNISAPIASVLGNNLSGFYTLDELKNIAANQKLQKELSLKVAEEIENDSVSIRKTWLERIEEILTDKHGECTIPKSVLREVARCLLPNILAFFETESGRKEFEEWKKQKQLASACTGDAATQKKDEA